MKVELGDHLDSIKRLFQIANQGTGQSKYAANFLLAWWNAGSCGGFDFTNLWQVDQEISDDMVTVFAYISRTWCYPDKLGFEKQFVALVEEWRPHLKTPKSL